MPHPLEVAVQSVRQRARGLTLLYGLGRVLAIGVAGWLLLGTTDFLIRIEDPGVRVIWSLLGLALLVWCAYRFLWCPLRHRRGNVEIARRIERTFPQLEDRLSSGIEFLAQSESDPTAGSAELRRAVINRVGSDLESLDLSPVLDRRPTLRAVAVALLVGIGALAICLWQPRLAQVGLARLVNPLGRSEWPKAHRLAFKKTPRQLAVGQPFEVELVDLAGRLPSSVRLHYRYTVGDEVTEEVEPMQRVGDLMLAHKDHITRPFEYRAEGGDDHSMEWISLVVVEPPRVEAFEVTLHPPAYTGFPATSSEKRIRALRGTRVEIAGTATKPLRSASVKLDSGARYAATLDATGFGFKIAPADFLVDESTMYSFELTDREDLIGGAETRWEIRAITDSPPSVSIEDPATNIFVTSDAALPVRILAKDNLRIASVSMEFTRSDRSNEEATRISLYTGPEKVTPLALDAPPGSLEAGESQPVEHRWELGPLGLKPGDLLSLSALASDYLPQVGQSAISRRITIISPAELEDRLAQRQGVILAELSRALQMQRDARSQVSRLEIQHREVGHLDKGQIDALQAAELNQRQVQRTLTSPEEGISSQIQNLLDDLSSNRVDSPEIERRMKSFQAELARLDEQELPAVRNLLTSAMKSAQVELTSERTATTSPEQKAIRTSLETAGQEQESVIGTLQRLLGELSEWSDYRRYARDVRQLQQDQHALKEATGKTAVETLSKEPQQLDRQQTADLKKLALEQLELSRRFDKIAQGMEQTSDDLNEKDPLAAATLEDALHQLRQAGISSQMRAAARAIEQNQMFGAGDNQQAVAEKLNELLDILSNRRERELGRLVKKLREAEQELEALRKKQQGLQKKRAAAQAEPDADERQRELARLKKESEQLQAEIDRLARRLKRLQAEQAASAAQRGAQRLGKADAAAQQGDAGVAGEEAHRAEQDLEEAQQALAEARQQAEADLAEEMLARFEDTIKALLARQQQVLAETARLEAARDEQGVLRPEQMDSVRILSREQLLLQEETAGHATKLGEKSAFALALEGVSRAMQRASQLLSGGETGPATQSQERFALERLARLMKAFEKDDEPQQKPGQEAGGEGAGQGQSAPDLAELKLLKLLQADLKERTLELSEEVGTGPPNEEQLGEYAELELEQGRLADLVFRLLEPPTDPATEDSPDQLPDLRKELEGDLPKLDLQDFPHSPAG
jgi:hypothetical protein